MSARIWPIESTMDLQKHVGKMVYLILYDDNIMGSTKLSEINECMLVEELLVTYVDDPANVTFLYGVVLNVAELPMELPGGLPHEYDLWAIKNDSFNVESERLDDVEAAAEYIECSIEDSRDALDLDDFAVLLARELQCVLSVISPSNEIPHAKKVALGVL